MITASNLTERIQVFAPSVVRSTYGAQDVTYLAACSCWARVQYSRGARALDHGEQWMQSAVVITTRLIPCLTDRCRIRWDGKLYQIDSFNRSRAEGSITMTCSRIDEGNPEAEPGSGSGSGE